MSKTKYIIDPSEVDIDSLYNYLIRNLSFDDVLLLYIKLRIKISTGSDKE